MIDTLFGKSVKSLVPRFQKGHSSQTCVIPELNLTLNFVDNILNTFSGDYEIGKLIKKYIEFRQQLDMWKLLRTTRYLRKIVPKYEQVILKSVII